MSTSLTETQPRRHISATCDTTFINLRIRIDRSWYYSSNILEKLFALDYVWKCKNTTKSLAFEWWFGRHTTGHLLHAFPRATLILEVCTCLYVLYMHNQWLGHQQYYFWIIISANYLLSNTHIHNTMNEYGKSYSVQSNGSVQFSTTDSSSAVLRSENVRFGHCPCI